METTNEIRQRVCNPQPKLRLSKHFFSFVWLCVVVTYVVLNAKISEFQFWTPHIIYTVVMILILAGPVLWKLQKLDKENLDLRKENLDLREEIRQLKEETNKLNRRLNKLNRRLNELIFPRAEQANSDED